MSFEKLKDKDAELAVLPGMQQPRVKDRHGIIDLNFDYLFFCARRCCVRS